MSTYEVNTKSVTLPHRNHYYSSQQQPSLAMLHKRFIAAHLTNDEKEKTFLKSTGS